MTSSPKQHWMLHLCFLNISLKTLTLNLVKIFPNWFHLSVLIKYFLLLWMYISIKTSNSFILVALISTVLLRGLTYCHISAPLLPAFPWSLVSGSTVLYSRYTASSLSQKMHNSGLQLYENIFGHTRPSYPNNSEDTVQLPFLLHASPLSATFI